MKITHNHRIVLLAANDKKKDLKEVCLWFSKGLTEKLSYSYVHDTRTAKKVHLYLLSDEKLQENDWAVNIYQNRVFKFTKEMYEHWEDDTHTFVKKVVASTNEELGLPDFTPDFKQVFCNNTGITEVQVEYESHLVGWDTVYDEEFGDCQDPVYQEIIKVDSNNFVFVDKITETQDEKKYWSKEEVVELMRSAWNAKDTEYQKNSERSYHPHFFTWIKSNPLNKII